MKLWKIVWEKGRSYDTFDSAVVAAMTKDEALRTNPLGVRFSGDGDAFSSDGLWTKDPNDVEVTFLGTAEDGIEQGVICASFDRECV